MDDAEPVLSVTRSLVGLKCSLESLRLFFIFDEQEVFAGDNYTDEDYDVAEVIAGNKELSSAVASFSVKKVIEIVVDSCDVVHCEAMQKILMTK